MGLGWLGVAFAAGGRAAGVAAGDAAGVDQADGRELGGELAVALFVVGEALGGGGRWNLVCLSGGRSLVSIIIPDSMITVWYDVASTGGATLSQNRRTRAARLRGEETAIKRRLQRAVRPNVTGPVLGQANIAYELSARTKGTAHGGIGAIAKLVNSCGLAGEIDCSLELLKLHKPYYESDHVLNIAYNTLCGGQRLEDIEARRCDRVLLDGLGTESLPDPTVARPARRVLRAAGGDRRRCQHRGDRRCDQTGDGHLLQRHLGYSALVVSLANTKEPLYLGLLGANRPSHEGVIAVSYTHLTLPTTPYV